MSDLIDTLESIDKKMRELREDIKRFEKFLGDIRYDLYEKDILHSESICKDCFYFKDNKCLKCWEIRLHRIRECKDFTEK